MYRGKRLQAALWAFIEKGDIITLDVNKRVLHLYLSDEKIQKRKQDKKPNDLFVTRGYVHLYQQQVEQAHLGANFTFLKGGSGMVVVKDSH